VAASALLERYGNAHMVMEQEGFHIDRKIYYGGVGAEFAALQYQCGPYDRTDRFYSVGLH